MVTIAAGSTPYIAPLGLDLRISGANTAGSLREDWSKWFFHGTLPAWFQYSGGIPGGRPTTVYASLHTSDPGEAGDQTSNELTTGAYPGYARVAISRTSTGWTIDETSGGNGIWRARNALATQWARNTSGVGVDVTHIGIGTAASGSGANDFLCWSVPINSTASAVLTNAAEQKLMKLLFENTMPAWDGTFGAPAGTYYGAVSLHTSSPGITGDQSTNECSISGYARGALNRNIANWPVALVGGDYQASNNVNLSFGTIAAAGPEVATHVGFGSSETAGVAGRLLWHGSLAASISLVNGVTPAIYIGDAKYTLS